MKGILTLAFTIIVGLKGYSQLAPDFMITDTEGVEHNLYADHLDQGQTVVVELFFVNCPPCRATAPGVQERYVQWGEGNADVEFIKLSTQNGDSNADVAQFKADLGTTFPGAGFDGGAAEARAPYRNGLFGTFFGTPYFAVVAPDGTVNGGLALSQLNDAIAATGATGGNTVEPDPFTTYNLNYSTSSNTDPESVIYILEDQSSSQSFNITQITSGSNTFDYPSDMFPAMQSQ